MTNPALGSWHHDDVNFIRHAKFILMFVSVFLYVKLLLYFTLRTSAQKCGIFLLEGTEDKTSETSVRKLSSSDVISEKVREYSSVDEE